MQDDSIAANPTIPQLSTHAVRNLSATRVWAQVAGSAFLGLAVLKLIQGGIMLVRAYDQMNAGYIEHARGIGMLFGGGAEHFGHDRRLLSYWRVCASLCDSFGEGQPPTAS